MKGFLSATSSRAPLPMVARCGACGLYRSCLSPKMPVHGRGTKGIMLIGESPGATEDEQGKPFVGASGQLLRSTFRRYGIEIYEHCWTINCVRCRPPKNQLPEASIDHCRPLVIEDVMRLKPKVIVLIGSAAVKSLIGWSWKEDPGGVGRWAGYLIPERRLNAWVTAIYHPAHLLRNQDPRKKDPAEAIWHRHVQKIAELTERPYDSPPDDTLRVRKVQDPDKAASVIEGMVAGRSHVAFDYETNRLKPDHEDARIICCSVSDGVTSVAFPWHGRVKKLMKEVLSDPQIKKSGWAISFENKWTRREFGRDVQGWVFDGMLAAHTLDTRRGTKSLKFQAYARLGAESYDDQIKPYLQAEGGNNPNRVCDLDVDSLLHYCGMDSLLEHQLSGVLSREVGIEL